MGLCETFDRPLLQIIHVVGSFFDHQRLLEIKDIDAKVHSMPLGPKISEVEFVLSSLW